MRSRWLSPFLLLLTAWVAAAAQSDEPAVEVLTSASELPPVLHLSDALRLLGERSLDVASAEEALLAAKAQVRIAGAKKDVKPEKVSEAQPSK